MKLQIVVWKKELSRTEATEDETAHIEIVGGGKVVNALLDLLRQYYNVE